LISIPTLHCPTEANYLNGGFYHYTYDAVGNRETQQKSILGLVTNDTYVYDDANRLTSLNSVNYTWDDNGNLLNEGVNVYTYDSANRLKSMSNQSTVTSYQYNGLGDRLRETVNGVTTTFTMDLNAGLTQALSESAPQGYGTHTYIYGNGRIARTQGGGTEYFLGDALGSVRQLTNASGAITYAKAYDPYGMVTTTSGASSTAYGYTNEYTSQGLVYLRARHYAPGMGRFLTRDIWDGNYNRPLSLNRWMYVEGNSINLTDPSGMCAQGKCGPDYTDWFVGQMTDHYQYGQKIRALRWKMKQDAYHLYWIKMFNCGSFTLMPTVFLSEVATEKPFREIVAGWYFPRTNRAIGRTPITAPTLVDPIINSLGILEYALYGLAIDYSSVEYPPAPQCNTPGCDKFGSENHKVITICNKCMDVSDLGNLMFGLGGQARGYSFPFTYGSAATFNGLDDKSLMAMLGVDGRGAMVGWIIGNTLAYQSRSTFCSTINSLDYLQWNENSSELNNQCAACNVQPSILPDATGASSLETVSASDESTLDWLRRLLPQSLK